MEDAAELLLVANHSVKPLDQLLLAHVPFLLGIKISRFLVTAGPA